MNDLQICLEFSHKNDVLFGDKDALKRREISSNPSRSSFLISRVHSIITTFFMGLS